ncbi:MAG: galactitol-1-phosphate 5-dehydrogenase [Fibromonadales bacterium]|nr:galactitol-1-phosphate 5-dehydrogenase [Fibromonadales bacterium]
MKAWVLHSPGDLCFEDVLEPTPKFGEVLVKVKCAGICSSDIARIFSTGAYRYPLIPGHEFSGETADGRRVGVFPLLPCFECESCKLKTYETCSNYSYIGSRQDGAFAEYIAVPKWNLVEIPDNMSFEVAALLEPAAVALHAVKQFDLQNISSIVVVGNGVIGKLVAKWLRIYGANNVELLGRGDTQRLAYYDACVEAVGSMDSLRRCMDLVRPNGEIVLVGNPSNDFCIEQKLYWQILRKQINIHGSWNSRYPSDWQQVIEHADKLYMDGLISHRYLFENLSEALAMRCSGGKYMILLKSG